jgi:hypothetical protein
MELSIENKLELLNLVNDGNVVRIMKYITDNFGSYEKIMCYSLNESNKSFSEKELIDSIKNIINKNLYDLWPLIHTEKHIYNDDTGYMIETYYEPNKVKVALENIPEIIFWKEDIYNNHSNLVKYIIENNDIYNIDLVFSILENNNKTLYDIHFFQKNRYYYGEKIKIQPDIFVLLNCNLEMINIVIKNLILTSSYDVNNIINYIKDTNFDNNNEYLLNFTDNDLIEYFNKNFNRYIYVANKILYKNNSGIKYYLSRINSNKIKEKYITYLNKFTNNLIILNDFSSSDEEIDDFLILVEEGFYKNIDEEEFKKNKYKITNIVYS